MRKERPGQTKGCREAHVGSGGEIEAITEVIT